MNDEQLQRRADLLHREFREAALAAACDRIVELEARNKQLEEVRMNSSRHIEALETRLNNSPAATQTEIDELKRQIAACGNNFQRIDTRLNQLEIKR